MKTSSILTSLFIVIVLVSCLRISKTERRVVALPQGDPKSNITNCESIARSVLTPDIHAKLQAKFPDIPPKFLEEIRINWNVGTYSRSGKEFFITIETKNKHGYSNSSAVLDFLELKTQEKVDAFFAKKSHEHMLPEP